MSTTTPNMGLIKPALTDVADIADINDNMDKLDGHSHLGSCGRLTLTSGYAVSTSDVTAATNVYFTPYKGNRIALYVPASSSWVETTFTERTLPLTGFTANTNYDVFIYDNAGTLSLAAVAWSDATTRATALYHLNGVYVKSGAYEYRYLGTIRITPTAGQCEDSTARRFVWNYYNRVPRSLVAKDSTGSWTYTTATYRAANNNTADGVGRFSFVIGVAGDPVTAFHHVAALNNTAAVTARAGIDLDGTTGNSPLTYHGYITQANVREVLFTTYTAVIAAGHHYLQKTEYSTATGTTTWYTTSAGTHGMIGEVWS